MGWSRVLVTAVGMAAMTAAGARAQTGGATQAPPPVTAGWQDGFVLQSANGENRLVLGLMAQVDGRFPLDDGSAIPATFTIRKARPTFSGRIAKYFDFKLMPDFGAGAATIQDAYIDVRMSPKFRIRSGKDKTPVGYELLQGDAYVLFPERSLASSLVPTRDVGFQAQGDLAHVSYSGGIFNGVPDGTSSTTDVDTNGSKDFAGRVVWQPFRSATAPAGALDGLGFHLGGSAGNQAGSLPTFRTASGQAYFSYVTGATASGERQRITPAVFYYYKSFGGFAEYVRSAADVLRADTVSRIANQAWEVTGSYVLTGEAASDLGVHPTHNFDPANDTWGALQVAARYSELRVDPLAFTNGLATPSSNQHARTVTVGASWYLNSFFRYYVSFERTLLDGGAPARRENLILCRVQLAF